MSARQTVRKAVFPAAGLGTRVLPATKVLPKEMLPLVDKPIIQYGIEEAVAAGLYQIVLVTSRGKSMIEDHFDVQPELEARLASRGKQAELDQLHAAVTDVQIAAVRQAKPLGLGHAVLVSRPLVGDEPFAVILCDDVIDANPPGIRQLLDVFGELGGPVIAVERVPRDAVSRYGIVAPEVVRRGVYRVRDLVEKPAPEEAPSDLAIIGRYVLTPDLFPVLERTAFDASGEIQLTDGLKGLLQNRPLYACEIDGVRHDAGNKPGFICASIYFALKHPEVGGAVREYLRTLDLEEAASA